MSTDWRPSFNAGLARLIDRERRSYQQLAEKVAADELMVMTSRSDAEQKTSVRTVDAAVQSDQAVHLLAAAHCPEEVMRSEKRVAVPQSVDKGTITENNWLLVAAGGEVVPDSSFDVEHLVVVNAGADTKSAPGNLLDKNAEKKEEQKEEVLKIENSGRSVDLEAERQSHGIHWAILAGEHRREMTPVKRHSEKFACELLMPAPWAARSSVTRLNLPGLERHKAVLARSDEHMVIIEVESSEERTSDVAEQSLCDRVSMETLLNDKVGRHSTETSVASRLSHVKIGDGKYRSYQ